MSRFDEDSQTENIDRMLMKSIDNQSAKADAGKMRYTLVPSQIIHDVAEVREYGLKKYRDPNNWKRVELERYINAAFRHFDAFVKDYKSKDAESGIEHYKHLACNIAFICELMRDE